MSDGRKNSLFEIPVKSFPILRDKFKVDWPNHILAFSLLDNYFKRFTKSPESQKLQKVYSLNGEWENDGTFVSVMYEHKLGRHVMFATLDPKYENLRTALKLLEYTSSKTTLFMCVKSVYRPIIYEVIKEQGLHILFDDGTKMKYIRKEDAKQFNVELPPNLQLRPLTIENAVKIDSVWPMKTEGSVTFIEYMITNNVNVGLFDDANELVAWCLQLDFGSLATLQVDEKHFRKGFGEMVTKVITKKIADENDVDVTSNIVFENFKSLSLFEKLGFEETDINYWIGVEKLSI